MFLLNWFCKTIFKFCAEKILTEILTVLMLRTIKGAENISESK